VSDDDTDDDDHECEGLFGYPLSYEELEKLYEHTLRGVEKESKQEPVLYLSEWYLHKIYKQKSDYGINDEFDI
ncbi:MAG: hypothetical protein IKS69_01115, partial [Erysipelotrichaceae bacterium]|nr:hypothetical protein [Erysipelotrichaceae bacterium]